VLEEKGVPTYLSHCLSLAFARRPPEQVGDKVVVASRDRDIIDLLPPDYRSDHLYVNHYAVKDSFSAYMAAAQELLALYRTRAPRSLSPPPCIARCHALLWAFRRSSFFPARKMNSKEQATKSVFPD